MSSINKVILIGYVGKDPETRYTQQGLCVANFSLATSETWNKVEKTEWHKIVAFGKLGEICGEYVFKGRQVYVEGRIQTNTWEDKDGNQKQDKKIIAYIMQVLGNKDFEEKNDVEQEDIPF